MKTKQQKRARKRAARKKLLLKLYTSTLVFPLATTDYIRRNIVHTILKAPEGRVPVCPLHFGNFAFVPELIVSDDIAGKGIQVHPRYPTAEYLAKHPELMFKEVNELTITHVDAKTGWFDNRNFNPTDVKKQVEDSMVMLRGSIMDNRVKDHILSPNSDAEMVFRRNPHGQLEQLYVNLFNDEENSNA